MRLIVGLGNPGIEYEKTRHNAGFLAINALSDKYKLAWSLSKKCRSELARTNEVILAKPETFMNNSGEAVRTILSYYKLLPKKLGFFLSKNADFSQSLIVIHDDIDIELGQYKISQDSRSAGHKGVESIISQLKTKNFIRLRLGIHAPSAISIPTEKFVLQKFNTTEMDIIFATIDRALSENIFHL
jgi:PTH1 family peptidyl-tRNA hydrolase